MADLTSVCGEKPGNACEWVWNNTHNEALANAAQWVLDKPLQILLAVIVTFVALWVLRRVTRRAMRKFVILGGRNPLTTEAPELLEQRAETLATVSASTVGAFVLTLGGLWILAILGVDVRALALGSAFVAAALGFGAQQIVKDVLAGFLMLVENQFGVGDTITVNDVEGVVERVSIRLTDVRDAQGTLWHIANGDVRVLGNKSSEYSTAVVDVAVASRVSATEALDVVTQLTEEAAKDPQVARRLLQPPRVMGLQSVDTERSTIRVTARTQPGAQWDVQRYIRFHMKEGLDAKGLSPGSPAPPVTAPPSG